MRSGLSSPVAGAIVVDTAYGELFKTAKGARYVSSVAAFAYPAKKNVLSAMTGTARYYPALTGFGKTIIVTRSDGAQTLYAGIASLKIAFKKNVAHVLAGHAMALSAGPALRFAYAPAGGVVKASSRSNPCGSGNTAATATVSVMPENVAVYARFHALTVNGVPVSPGPFPSGNPDVGTPASIASSNVAVPATLSPTVYERSDTFASYYVVLCGNAAFASGPARYAGPYAYANSQTSVVYATPSPLPQVLFFTDPGANGADLTAQLPLPAGQADSAACPAAPPANFYNQYALTFNEVGQTYWVWYSCSISPDTIALTPANTSVVTASPSPLTEYSSPQPNWPPPQYRADFTAKGVGGTTVTPSDSDCPDNDTAIAVTVNATPSPAPTPTAMPN